MKGDGALDLHLPFASGYHQGQGFSQAAEIESGDPGGQFQRAFAENRLPVHDSGDGSDFKLPRRRRILYLNDKALQGPPTEGGADPAAHGAVG